MSAKEEFIEIYKENIHREGADRLLEYLHRSDFFRAPSSSRYHGAHEGGLVEHSVNVYHCLKDYLARPRVQELYGMRYSEETIAWSTATRPSPSCPCSTTCARSTFTRSAPGT